MTGVGTLGRTEIGCLDKVGRGRHSCPAISLDDKVFSRQSCPSLATSLHPPTLRFQVALYLQNSPHACIFKFEVQSLSDLQDSEVMGTGPQKSPPRPCGAAQGSCREVSPRPDVSIKATNAGLLEAPIR